MVFTLISSELILKRNELNHLILSTANVDLHGHVFGIIKECVSQTEHYCYYNNQADMVLPLIWLRFFILLYRATNHVGCLQYGILIMKQELKVYSYDFKHFSKVKSQTKKTSENHY